MTGEKVRQENAKSPYFCGRSLVGLLEEHLRRSVSGSTEEEVIEGPGRGRICDDGAAEIDKFDLYRPGVGSKKMRA